ncbi:MAG: flagellar hook-basal body complex protein FliE [Desulfamplus sp.]|nr:flagellar hook-basal body complex protein FliE [Desulfamplus sp.]MBF0257570.1 flagellar hook-basal body complex protein FliE [Desulfamplus sp.]
MTPISGIKNNISNGIDKSIGKISLNTEPLHLRVGRRDPSFAERLNFAVKDVNSKQNLADEATEGVMKDEVGIHEGMLAIGKADTSLRLLMQVKSKAMEAYKEIINMQL